MSLGKYNSKQIILLVFFWLFVGIGGIYFFFYLITPCTGLVNNYPEVIREPEGLLFSPRTLGSLLVRSGLRPGEDYIREINGIPVKNMGDYLDQAYKITRFVPFTLTVRRGEEDLAFTLTPEPAFLEKDWLFSLMLIGLLVFTGRHFISSYPSQKGMHILGLSSGLYILVVALKPFFYRDSFTLALIHLGAFSPWMLFFFCLHWPEPRLKTRNRHLVMGVIILIYFLFSVYRLYLIHSWLSGHETSLFTRFRILGKLNNGTNAGAYILFGALLWKSYVREKSLRLKNRLKWILGGVLFALLANFLFEELLLFLDMKPGQRIQSGNFSYLFLGLIPVAFYTGLEKDHIFPARAYKKFLSRSLPGGIILFVFFAFFYIPLKDYLAVNNGLEDRWAAFLTTVLLFAPLIPLQWGLSFLEARIWDPFPQGDYPAFLEKENLRLKIQFQEDDLQRRGEDYLNHYRDLQSWLSWRRKREGEISRYLESSREIYQGLIPFLPPHEGGEARDGLDGICSALEALKGLEDWQQIPLRPPVEERVELAFLLKKGAFEAGKEFPLSRVVLKDTPSREMVCYPEELSHAFSLLLAFSLKKAGGNGFVTLHTYSEEKCFFIRFDAPGGDGFRDKRDDVFRPYPSRGGEGIDLYLARLFIRMNRGEVVLDREGALVSFPGIGRNNP